MLVKMLQQPPGASGLEQQVSLERDRSRKWWCSRDHRATEKCRNEMTVAGVGRVVIRETGRHTLKVVERRDQRTGVA